jgi:hypothetical protein
MFSFWANIPTDSSLSVGKYRLTFSYTLDISDILNLIFPLNISIAGKQVSISKCVNDSIQKKLTFELDLLTNPVTLNDFLSGFAASFALATGVLKFDSIEKYFESEWLDYAIIAIIALGSFFLIKHYKK